VLAVTVVATRDVVPYAETLRVMERKRGVSSFHDVVAAAPWMCTSMKPGTAVLSVARISCAPAGRAIPERGPMASMMSSRIRIPASAISVIG